MAVTFEGAGTFAGSAGTATPGIPAGTIADDILLLFVDTANQAATLSTANGFAATAGTPLGTGTAGAATATRMTTFWKRAVGGDAAPVVADSGDHQATRIGCWRGVKKIGDPWNVTPAWAVDATSDTSGDAPSVTTTVAGCGIIVAVSNVIDSNTGLTITYNNAGGTTITGTGMGDNTNQGLGGGLNVGFGVQAAAGATGLTTCTYSTASQKSMVTIALEPEPVAPNQMAMVI